MRIETFVTALLLAAAPSALQAAKLYKWVDERGVTHYADRPPAQPSFEEIEIKEPKREAQGEEASAPAADQAPTPGERISAEEARRRNCESSRSVLAQLEANPQVRMDTNGDGVLEDLSPAERRAQIDLYRRKVREFCTG
jgi:hypothetical protein